MEEWKEGIERTEGEEEWDEEGEEIFINIC